MKKIIAAALIAAIAVMFTSCFSDNKPIENETSTQEPADVIPVASGESNGFKYVEYKNHIELTECLSSAVYVALPSSINGKPVTSFGRIFYGNMTAATVVIPETYTAIDERAFEECFNLQNVVIREGGIKSIGSQAFLGCQSLKLIEIPKTVTDIATDAFKYCTDLIIVGTVGTQAQKIADMYNSVYFREAKSTTPSSTEEQSAGRN